MTQCYNSQEIDETIHKLIRNMSEKWNCNESIAKQKLAEHLWTFIYQIVYIIKYLD